MLIAEKCANRSSPPPSGVIKPKPFASLNHFTVPVAIVGNSLSTRINGTLPDRCFDLKESTAVERLNRRSYRACFTAWNKTRPALYVISAKLPMESGGCGGGVAFLRSSVERSFYSTPGLTGQARF